MVERDQPATKVRFLAPTLIAIVAVFLVGAHRYVISTILGIAMLVAALVWIGVLISQERRP